MSPERQDPAPGAPSIEGTVVGGDRRGRTLGFPTANIAVSRETGFLEDGVYACWVSFPPETELRGATLSVGKNPTFDDVDERRLEAFIHDLDADLYGRSIEVRIAGLLRPMLRFDSVQELIDHTRRDIEHSRKRLRASSGHTLEAPCGTPEPE